MTALTRKPQFNLSRHAPRLSRVWYLPFVACCGYKLWAQMRWVLFFIQTLNSIRRHGFKWIYCIHDAVIVVRLSRLLTCSSRAQWSVYLSLAHFCVLPPSFLLLTLAFLFISPACLAFCIWLHLLNWKRKQTLSLLSNISGQTLFHSHLFTYIDI